MLKDAWQLAPVGRVVGQSLVMLSGLDGVVGKGEDVGDCPRLVAVTVRVWGMVEAVMIPKSNSTGERTIGCAGLVMAGRLAVMAVAFAD